MAFIPQYSCLKTKESSTNGFYFFCEFFLASLHFKKYDENVFTSGPLYLPFSMTGILFPLTSAW